MSSDTVTSDPVLSGGPISRRRLLGLGGRVAMASMAGAALAACGGGQSGSAKGTITTWVYPLIGTGSDDQNLWNKIAADFHKKHPGINVTVQVQPWTNRVEKLTAAMAAGRGPDVWYINVEDVPNHAQHKRLVTMDSVLSDKSDFFPKALDALTFQGKLYAAPILLSVEGTYFNSKLFQQAGVDYPKTWKDVLAIGPAFRSKGMYLTQIDPTNPQDSFYPFIYQAGGKPFSTDGKKSLLNSQAGIDALTFVSELVRNKYAIVTTASSQGTPVTETPLGKQDAAAGLNNAENSAMVQLAQAWGQGVMKIGAPLKDKAQITVGTVAGYAISSQAKSRSAAEAWVKYLVGQQVMKQIDTTSGYFAPRKSMPNLYPSDPILGPLQQYLPMVQPPPANLVGRQVAEDVLAPEIQAVFSGQKTPKQALDEAESQANQLLQQNGG